VGVRSETYFNTPEQVREYLRAALLVVEELEVPEDLRAVAFTAAINLTSSKHVTEMHPGAPVDLSALRGNPDLRG
jgi:hypothetical protein